MPPSKRLPNKSMWMLWSLVGQRQKVKIKTKMKIIRKQLRLAPGTSNNCALSSLHNRNFNMDGRRGREIERLSAKRHASYWRRKHDKYPHQILII